MTKASDYDEVRDLLDEFGSPPTSAPGAKSPSHQTGSPDTGRRWVVERLHSWMNRFRRILTRWEKRADTYLAMLHLACGIITWRTLQAHEHTGLSK